MNTLPIFTLLRNLADKNPKIRQKAARALRDIGLIKDVPKTLAAMKHELGREHRLIKKSEEQSMFVLEFNNLLNLSTIKKWIRTIGQKNAAKRLTALQALGEFYSHRENYGNRVWYSSVIRPVIKSDTRIFFSLAHAARDNDPYVRRAALFLLGFSRKKDALSVLFRGLCDNRLSVVYEAADSIGLNRKEIAGPLILLCSSTSRITRMGASYLLRNFTGKRVAQVLYGLLNDPCARVRIQILETWKDHARFVDAVPKIIDMLFSEPTTEGREVAIWALSIDLKESRAYYPFLKLLTTERNQKVRQEAIRNLRYIPFVPPKKKSKATLKNQELLFSKLNNTDFNSV